MTIELDWDVSDAPIDDDAPHDSILEQPVAPPSLRPAERRRHRLTGWLSARVVRRWPWLAGAVMLVTLAGVGLWIFTQSAWQEINTNIAAAVKYEDQAAIAGTANLVLNVQDHGNADWLGVRQHEALARQPAPLPVPMLNFSSAPANVTGLTAMDADFLLANVSRQFTTPDGQTLTFTLPQFYRRGTADDWLRSAPPGSFWGNWLDWQGALLVIRYSERDQAFVNQVAPLLDERLRAACSAWSGGCPAQTAARLYLSGFVGSLEYDPLANTEVRIELGAPGGNPVTPPDYFLSIPSPQIAGIPTDDAGRAYLADYLTVRLIASLARHVAPSPQAYYLQTSQAIQALNLGRADPGYVVGGRRPFFSRFGGSNQGSAPGGAFGGRGRYQLAWRVVYYTTVPGDTLAGIAARFSTSVFALERANRLRQTDSLAAGIKLTVPLLGPDPTPSP